MTVEATPSCPKCGAAAPMPIVYGNPGPNLAEAAARGEIELGGCIIQAENPAWKCRACGERFTAIVETGR
jgi:YgiT-type zinc finger domain-containing protein